MFYGDSDLRVVSHTPQNDCAAHSTLHTTHRTVHHMCTPHNPHTHPPHMHTIWSPYRTFIALCTAGHCTLHTAHHTSHNTSPMLHHTQHIPDIAYGTCCMPDIEQHNTTQTRPVRHHAGHNMPNTNTEKQQQTQAKLFSRETRQVPI